ncbi:MAG: SRPBCC family protein [Flavobacteriales bacterium]
MWSQLDPNTEMSFKGLDGEVGFVWYWNSNDDMGEGEHEIFSITEDRIEMELRFIRPFNMQSQTYYNVTALNDKQTKVEWVINGSFPYPFNIFLPLMGMDNSIGKNFEQGLSEFKRLVEQMSINAGEAQQITTNN